ncbi:natural killer cell receptor 2B4-like [Dromaius novaehollandiae]|uniref:natural killer cell receptor 2B4-like n=1 Tax=Dromaius novaehollandiae TaxID=8790 RepID=UPI00311E11B5
MKGPAGKGASAARAGREQGPKGATDRCEDVAVAVGAVLRLVPEKPPLLWESIDWRVRLDTREQFRILTASARDVKQPPKSRFSRRVAFERGTLSLRISPVSKADSGVYSVHFVNASNFEFCRRFCVSVLAPVCQPVLEARVVHREHGWCNLSLTCAVPCAGNVTYSWLWAGAAPEALGHRRSLWLQLPEGANGTVYLCNASNAVSWAAASTDVSALCSPPGFFPVELWWTLAAALGLLLAVSVALVLAWRCRRRPGPTGNAEQPLTIYAEVGNAWSSRNRNGSSEAASIGNTIYAMVHTTPGPSCPREPESHTIYSTVQVSKRSPSAKRMRIEPSLISTAYVEVTDPVGPRSLGARDGPKPRPPRELTSPCR